MAVVMNLRDHAVPLTTGLLAPRATKNVDTSLPLEAALIADGSLAIVDANVEPPAPVTPAGDWKPTRPSDEDLPDAGNNDGDVRITRDDYTPYVWHVDAEQWIPLLAAAGALEGVTVDTSEAFKLILLSDGTVRAIPSGAVAPAVPTGLAVDAKLTSVRLSWSAAARAATYRVTRDGVQVAVVSGLSFRDTAIQPGATYSYRVASIDQYGQRSAASAPASAFVDPDLNVAPSVTVTAWPPAPSTNGRSLLRVNAIDVNAQTLALALAVDVGSIQPTADPSVWLYTI